MYVQFVRRNGLAEAIRQVHENRQFLHSTWLLGEMISLPVQKRIARQMQRRSVKEDQRLLSGGRPEIVLLAEGLVTILAGRRPIENLTPGGFFGEETVLADGQPPAGTFEARALLDSTLYAVPGDALAGVPIVQWKLRETAERRLRGLRTEFRFRWQQVYELGIADLDGEHEALFAMIDRLDGVAAGREPAAGMPSLVDRLLELVRPHLEMEEARLASRRPARLPSSAASTGSS